MTRDDVVALLVAERFAPAPPSACACPPDECHDAGSRGCYFREARADRAAAEAEAHRAELLAALR